MKRTLLFRIQLCIAFMALIFTSLSAQNELLIESGGDIYNIIMGDTIADGTAVHDTYILERGGVYQQGFSFIFDRNIAIIGAAEPADVRPAMIMAKKDAAGDFFNFFFNLNDDVEFTLKNVVMQGRTAELDANNLSIVGCVVAVGKNVRIVVDNVVFNSFENNCVYIGAEGCYSKITNSKFRNCTNTKDDYTGNPIAEWGGPSWRDSLIVKNNTFVNVGSKDIYISNAVYEAIVIENNTFGGQLSECLAKGLFRQPNLTVNNNIFIGDKTRGHSAINNPIEIPLRDTHAVIKIDTIRDQDQLTVMQNIMGVTHQDRYNQVHNNVNYYPPMLVEAWKTMDYGGGACNPQIFLSGYTEIMVAEFPNIDESNNIGHQRSSEAELENSFDPQFADGTIELVFQAMIDWETAYRNNGDYSYWRNIDPEGKRFDLGWPLPEDFSYTNSEVLTASTTGGPVGDLNWISETNTRVKSNSLSASGIELFNYPNPFAGKTTISYTLEQASSLKLSVYDLTGKVVAILADEFQQSGPHQIEWNGSDSSGSSLPEGIYLYKIQTENYSAVERMIKL